MTAISVITRYLNSWTLAHHCGKFGVMVGRTLHEILKYKVGRGGGGPVLSVLVFSIEWILLHDQ